MRTSITPETSPAERERLYGLSRLPAELQDFAERLERVNLRDTGLDLSISTWAIETSTANAPPLLTVRVKLVTRSPVGDPKFYCGEGVFRAEDVVEMGKIPEGHPRIEGLIRTALLGPMAEITFGGGNQLWASYGS